MEKPSTTQPDFWRTSLVAGLVAVVGAPLKFWYLYLDDVAGGRPNMFARRVLEEGTGFFAFAVLIPGIVWAHRKFRFGEQHWYKVAPIHLAIAIVLSFCHTSLMAISRMVLSPLLGMGPYDYGEMRWRYPMEFSNFIVLYAMFMTALTLFDYYRELRHRQLAAAEMETRLAQAQLQNLQLQLQPHFLFNVLNTISSVMYEDVKRADAMLAQLSDLLQTIPSVGPISALTLVAAVDGIERFRCAKQLTSYCRIVPMVRASAERQEQGPITREGRSEVRAVWIQAAHSLARNRNPEARPLQRWFARVARRRGLRTAIVALAPLAIFTWLFTFHTGVRANEDWRRLWLKFDWDLVFYGRFVGH